MSDSGSHAETGGRYEYAECAFDLCGRRFRRMKKPGRPRRYCHDSCRRRAQRIRSRGADGEEAVVYSPRWGPGVAGRLAALAAELVEAERRGADLRELVERASAVGAEVTHYLGAAVHDARDKGMSWGDVAREAHVSEATARARWGRRVLHRRMRERARQVADPAVLPVVPVGAVAEAEPRERLGAAVGLLLKSRDVSAQRVAQAAGVSPSCVSRLLAGHRVPDWPVVFILVTEAGGRPEEFRLLWEWARGHRPPPRRSAAASLERFHGALRGLVWAAGEEAAGLRNAADGVLGAVLDGELVPDWDTVQRLVQELGGDPEQVRPLWEDVQYTFLLSHDFFPAKGVSGAGRLV
ncbi:MAG TPA: XRE family transcriptional regulator [Streptomyces sp.]